MVSALATDIVNVSNSLSSIAIIDKLNSDRKQIVIGSGTCGGIDAINVFNPNLVSSKQIHVYKGRYGLLDADIIFGYCGRICKDKGIVELVDGFRLFQKKHADLRCKLLLIGGRDARDSLTKDKLEDMRTDESIVMTGPMDKSELNNMYALMDVFILASYREGFPTCVLEASAMEKPILVTKSHGCIDSIIEHQTGEYIELTPQGICVGMEKMLNPNLRYAQGKNGREMVLQKYDHSVTWPLINDFYKHILS
ncbi:MAG: glycosyltransferase [Paludibacteraceae bacterium]